MLRQACESVVTRGAQRLVTRVAQGLVAVGVGATLAASAQADAAKVALVRDAVSTASRQKTLTRLRAELGAAGFEVTEIAKGEGDARESVEGTPLEPGTFATISIVERDGGALDIWVADRITGKTLVRRLSGRDASSSDASTILAVRAVELLRASLLEASEPQPRTTSAAPAAPPVEVPAEVKRWIQSERTSSLAADSADAFGLSAGLANLHSLSGVGPALLPVLGLTYRISRDFSLALDVGGPTFATDLAVPGGTIAVRQEIAWLEAAYQFSLAGGAVRPFVAVGAGVYHLDVAGTAEAPYRGETGDVFAVIASLGGGARIPLGHRVAVLLDAHLFFAAPRPTIFASGTEVADAFRPALLERAAVEVAF